MRLKKLGSKIFIKTCLELLKHSVIYLLDVLFSVIAVVVELSRIYGNFFSSKYKVF